MARASTDQLSQLETACSSLLYELQIIWEEVGECDAERDRMLFELEQECLEVYRRKVDHANRCRAQLRQTIADYEAELASICSAMGERPVHIRQSNQKAGSLKDELNAITPQLEEMRKRKTERLNQFLQVIGQIQIIFTELRPTEHSSSFNLDESDLSTRRLEDLYRQLESLQKEKSDRMKQVMDHVNTLNSLCSVLGIDFKEIIRDIHPSLNEPDGSKNISTSTIERLASAIKKLRMIKIERMQKLQDLATTMLELWNLMDTPTEEQQMFQNVTCNIAASEQEFTEANTLSLDFINYVEAEVSRLEELKVSKMKELVLKKKAELEELRRRIHLVAEANDEIYFAVDAIEAGAIDAAVVLEQIEDQIAAIKEEALSRKDILEKVEKWMTACEEEAWLEEYNRDENRFSAGRGAHLTLKRAEKARALVNKIPAIVETLAAKITQWEEDRAIYFTYDGVRLMSMLENYNRVRHEKEQERKRQRDQKKLQGQIIAEQETLYGSKPSPSKTPSAKKMPRSSTGGPNRRLSLGAAVLQPPKPTRPNKKIDDLPTLSPAARGLDISGLPTKKTPYNATAAMREVETPRKPFAPLLPFSNIPSTPTGKPMFGAAEEELKTARAVVPVPTPKTPMTVSAPMEVAATPARTPAPAPTPTRLFHEPEVKMIQLDEMEFSFEERRLAFYHRSNELGGLVHV